VIQFLVFQQNQLPIVCRVVLQKPSQFNTMENIATEPVFIIMIHKR
jgi:hypothetical protein